MIGAGVTRQPEAQLEEINRISKSKRYTIKCKINKTINHSIFNDLNPEIQNRANLRFIRARGALTTIK